MPKSAVPDGLLRQVKKVTHCPFKGNAAHWAATLADGTVVDPVAWSYEQPIDSMTSIAGYSGFYTNNLNTEFDPPVA